jgi:hypothetical protein
MARSRAATQPDRTLTCNSTGTTKTIEKPFFTVPSLELPGCANFAFLDVDASLLLEWPK